MLVRFNLPIFAAFKICLHGMCKKKFKTSLSFSVADIVDVVNVIGNVRRT